jgi:uncharacterized membrane protein
MQPQQVEFGEGINWYLCGWQLFRRYPVIWIVMFLVLALANLILVLVPVVGQLALVLLWPVFLGGLYHAAKSVDDDERLDIKMLFKGFGDKSRTSALLILGAMMLGATIVFTLIAASLLGGTLMTSYVSGSDIAARISAGVGSILGSLVLLLLEGLIIMVMVYAVPLVMLDDVTPIEAVKSSFNASLLNIVPLLVFGVICLVLALVAAIPFFLGYLILVPVTLCATYCSYKSIFHS